MNIVLAGAGGYGQTYLRSMETLGLFGHLCGVADPYASGSSYYGLIKERGIPVYDTLDEFYQNRSADLAIVSSPIHYHEEQTVTALNNNSHVLCEKPVAATVAQALRMKRVADEKNLKLGVGFQWSHSGRMRAFKNDVLNGRFGKPKCFKTMMYWPRPDSYYETSSWKGRLKSDGKPVNDSVVTNATAHYLHNIFFLLGDSMNAAAMPETARGSVFRFRNIESYDTIFLCGTFSNGAAFYYSATHSCGGTDVAVFDFAFEQCDVLMDIQMNIIVRLKDGTLENLYADVEDDGLTGKLTRMMEAIAGDTPVLCGVDTALPHLTVTNRIFDTFPIQNFDAGSIYKTENPAGAGVRGLYDAMVNCYKNASLPDEYEGFPLKDARVGEARFV